MTFFSVYSTRLVEWGEKMIEGDAKKLIQDAMAINVSDIHILPNRENYQIFYRVNGSLDYHSKQTIEWGKKLISYFKFLANMDVGEKRRPQSGSSSLIINNDEIELRFSTITNILLLESIVIRVLKPQQSKQNEIHTYFPQDIEYLRKLIQRKNGLVLFSGPVGSGKTTTIYQLLRERVAQEPLQVITMEDPVEIYESSFLQTEVNEKAGITYDMLIKSSLRHHPDILMIGEIRDEETARMAIRGALTGHLMIATIHAKNAQGVIARLEELKVTKQQLSQTLIGIVSQRLVPRYCFECQGTCRITCLNIPMDRKRAAIQEILFGSQMIQALESDVSEIFTTINKKLRKAWAYGYIDTQTYYKFEIV